MTPEIDRNDPLSHPFLAELLAEPPPKEFNSLVLNRYRRGVAAALTLPPGEARQHLLNALDGAVHASRRVRHLSDQVNDLQDVIAAASPEKAQMLKAIDVIGLRIKSLHAKFKEVWDKEKKDGREPRGYWPWFDHELHATTEAIRYSARGLLIQPPAPQTAAGDAAKSKDSKS